MEMPIERSIRKLAVITDSELASGFRLAGVEVYVGNSKEEAINLLRLLIENKEYGLIAVNEEVFKELDRDTERILEEEALPVVVPFPSIRLKMDKKEGEEYISELVRSCIGYYVKLK